MADETRRSMFKLIAGGMAAASALPAVSIAKDMAVEAPQEDPETLQLFAAFKPLIDEYREKEAAYFAALETGEQLWPRAPQCMHSEWEHGELERDITGRAIEDANKKTVHLQSVKYDFQKPRKPGRAKTFAKMAKYEADMIRWRRETGEIAEYEAAKQKALDVSGYELAKEEFEAVKRKMARINAALAKRRVKSMEGLRLKAQTLCWWTNDRFAGFSPMTPWLFAALLDDVLELAGRNSYSSAAIMKRLEPKDVERCIEHAGMI